MKLDFKSQPIAATPIVGMILAFATNLATRTNLWNPPSPVLTIQKSSLLGYRLCLVAILGHPEGALYGCVVGVPLGCILNERYCLVLQSPLPQLY